MVDTFLHLGLGLTCPEWPQCPNGFMPSAEYFVEWTHRLIAASVGVLVISTMVASLINKNSDFKIKITSSLATALVITQITLGALVIDLKLHAVLVSVHLGIGIFLFFNGTVNYSVCIPYSKNADKS